MFKKIICLLLSCLILSLANAAQRTPVGVPTDVEALWTLHGRDWELFTNQELVWSRLKNIVPMDSIRQGHAYWVKRGNQAFQLSSPLEIQKPVGVRIEKSGIAMVDFGLTGSVAIEDLLQKPDGSKLAVSAIYSWDHVNSTWITYRKHADWNELSHLEPKKGYFIETNQDGVVLLPAGAQALISIAGGGSLKDLAHQAFASLTVVDFYQDGQLRPGSNHGLIVHEPDVTRLPLRFNASAYLSRPIDAASIVIQPTAFPEDVQKLSVNQVSNLFLSQVVTLPELPQGDFVLWLEIASQGNIVKSEPVSLKVKRGGLAFGRVFHDLTPVTKTALPKILGSVSQIPNSGFNENPEMFQAASVNKIRVRVTGSDFAPLTQEFLGSATSGTVQIPIGNQRTVTVDYLDSFNDVIRRGQRQVSVLPTGNPPLELVRAETGIPDPLISPLPGAFLDAVTVSLSTTSGSLYYTLDGSDPKVSSSRFLVASGTTLIISNTTLIKAFVELSSTQRGGVFEYNFVKTQIPQASVTLASEDPFTNEAFLGDLKIEVASDQPRSFIYFTLNGSEPNLSSQFAALPTTLVLNETTEVKYFLVNEFGFQTTIQSRLFVKDTLPLLQIQSSADVFFLDQVSIDFSSMSGATEVVYSLNGSIPDQNSPRFSLPHSITVTESLTVIALPVSANGFFGNPEVLTYQKIDDLSVDYTVSSNNQVQALGTQIYFIEPVTVDLTTSYPDTTVFFSLDGSDPTIASSEFDLLNPPVIGDTTTLKLLVLHTPSGILSDVIELFFEKRIAPTVQLVSPAQNTMNTFSGSTTLLLTGSDFVFYSLDGSDPETDGSPEPAPLALNLEETSIVKVIPVDDLGFTGNLESIALIKISTPVATYTFVATQGAYQDGNTIYFSGDLSLQFSVNQPQTQGVGAVNPQTVPSYFNFNDGHVETFNQSGVFRFKALHDSGVYSEPTDLTLVKVVLPTVTVVSNPQDFSGEFSGSLGVAFTTTFPADLVEVENVTQSTVVTDNSVNQTISQTTTFVVRSMTNQGLMGDTSTVTFTKVLSPSVSINSSSPQGIVTGNRFTDIVYVELNLGAGADKILYTTDGSSPIDSGIEATQTVNLSFSDTVQIRAVALRNSGLMGAEVSQQLFYSPTDLLIAQFNPPLQSGRFINNTTLVLEVV